MFCLHPVLDFGRVLPVHAMGHTGLDHQPPSNNEQNEESNKDDISDDT